MDNFNKLTVDQNERLAWLLEELGEVQQAIGKILRHGYDSKNPDNIHHLGNRNDLERELSDTLYVLIMMNDKQDIDLNKIYHDGMEYTTKRQKYLHHQ